MLLSIEHHVDVCFHCDCFLGPTGIELSGELMDFFFQICHKPDGAYQHLKDDVSIMLIHGGVVSSHPWTKIFKIEHLTHSKRKV